MLRLDSLLGWPSAALLSTLACGGVEVTPWIDASIGGPDARPASCEGGATQLLSNPSFEEAVNPDGAVGWSEQSAAGEHLTFPEDQLGGFSVFEGNRAAWLGRAFEDDQLLSQRVAVPAATTALSLDAGESCPWGLVELEIQASHAGEISLLMRASTDEDTLTSFFVDAVALPALGPYPDDAG